MVWYGKIKYGMWAGILSRYCGEGTPPDLVVAFAIRPGLGKDRLFPEIIRSQLSWLWICDLNVDSSMNSVPSLVNRNSTQFYKRYSVIVLSSAVLQKTQ